MASQQISLAYSVDADDAFMFHALAFGRLDTPGLTFSHRREDTVGAVRTVGLAPSPVTPGVRFHVERDAVALKVQQIRLIFAAGTQRCRSRASGV